MKPLANKPHKTIPINTGEFGPKMDGMFNQNNPFRAAYFGGHELNESYKMPVPNNLGVNDSYMHPAVNKGGGTNTKQANMRSKLIAGPVKTGKNPSY